MGLMLTVFLFEHLITNSQAALWVGEDGIGFIRIVNLLHSMPYLQVIEWLLIGIPFVIHGYLGIRIALQGRWNSFPSNGARPSLPQYARNQAYTWQRITSWVLLFGVVGHVVHMRFLRFPNEVQDGVRSSYITKLHTDPGLYTVADRLQVGIFGPEAIAHERALLQQEQQSTQVTSSLEFAAGLPPASTPAIAVAVENQHLQQFHHYVAALDEESPLKPQEVMAVADNFGTAMLLIVRDSMKEWWMCILYSLLVLSGAFHGYNGLWTFMISWGTVLSARSQKWMSHCCMGMVGLFSFLGLAAVWGTYWINLYQ